MKARVSICIPAYNNVAEVSRLLSSLAVQTFRDWEIILTDDSTDGEIEGLAGDIREGQKNPGFSAGELERFTYVHNEKPLGHIFNWNRALELATGEYIKIMFSDDWFTEADSLEKMVKLLDENPRAALAFCGTRQVAEKRVWERKPGPGYVDRLASDYRLLFLGNEIGAPSAVIYRECGAKFDERSNWASDMFLYFDILEKNPCVAYTEEPLVSIGIHEEQYTGMFQEKDIRKYRDRRLMYEKYRLRECEACRREMLRLTVEFGQGRSEALECGASPREYAVQRLRWFWKNTILGYWNGGLYRLGKLFSGSCKERGKRESRKGSR